MNKTLQQFVNKSWIKQFTPQIQDIPTSKDEVQLFHKAGFERVATQKLTESQRVRALNNQERTIESLKDKYILLKNPAFEHKHLLSPTKIIMIQAIILLAFIGVVMAGIFFGGFGLYASSVGVMAVFGVLIFGLNDEWNPRMFDIIKLNYRKYLFEASVKDYKGHVPVAIAKTLIEYKNKKGFSEPRVWGIATRSELHGLIHQETVDPLLVMNYEGLQDYSVLIGVWGEDIEDLDKLFS